MKKAWRVLCLAALLVLASATIAFAESGGLEIVESYPEDGQTGTSVENLSVKLRFNSSMNGADTVTANEDCFTLKDEDGNEYPVKVYYNEDDGTEVLVLYDTSAEDAKKVTGNTKYELTISGDLVSDNGDTLGKDVTIGFKTLNQSLNTKVYMFMMVGMMIFMVFISSRQAKKQAEDKTDPFAALNAPFNPYKEAKRTGKSVEEVIAEHDKEMARLRAKAEKMKKEQEKYDAMFAEEDAEEEANDGIYRVKRRHRVSEGGSSYVTGRKAEAEARKAEEERLARRREKYAKGKKKKK
ncbi:MAG: Ig-like domain-containing protein [Eubacterium sp.]|jgi:hypothetical protein